MPANPQITHGHPLRRILNAHLPILRYRALNLPPQPPTGQQSLRRIRPHDTRPDRRAHHRLRVVEEKSVRRLPQRDAHRASHRRPDRSEMPAGPAMIVVVVVVVASRRRRPLQHRRELPQRRRGRRRSRARPQRPVPEREQRLPLRHARPPGHGAQRARVERGVPLPEPRGAPVRGQEVGQRGGREGGESQGEEAGEGVRCGSRVVREVGLEAAGEGEGA